MLPWRSIWPVPPLGNRYRQPLCLRLRTCGILVREISNGKQQVADFGNSQPSWALAMIHRATVAVTAKETLRNQERRSRALFADFPHPCSGNAGFRRPSWTIFLRAQWTAFCSLRGFPSLLSGSSIDSTQSRPHESPYSLHYFIGLAAPTHLLQNLQNRLDKLGLGRSLTLWQPARCRGVWTLSHFRCDQPTPHAPAIPFAERQLCPEIRGQILRPLRMTSWPRHDRRSQTTSAPSRFTKPISFRPLPRADVKRHCDIGRAILACHFTIPFCLARRSVRFLIRLAGRDRL